MNAIELMIGDWVYNNSFTTQVTQVNEDNEVWTRKDPFLPNENIMPIPLTEEILKANGFETNGEKDAIWYRVGTLFNLETEDGSFVKDMCGEKVTFSYVHEVQHALRSCGLNELADNFKIERYGCSKRI